MSENRMIRTRSSMSLESSNIVQNEIKAIKIEPIDDNFKETNQFCFENEQFKIKTEWPKIKTEILDENSNDEEIPDLLSANDSEINQQDVQDETLEKILDVEVKDFECRFKCGIMFSKKSQRHVHETLTRHYHCDICNKTCYFRIDQHRKSHMSPSEQIEYDRKCDICQTIFNSKLILEKHLKTHLKPSNAFRIKKKPLLTCKYCNKTFIRKDGLKVHIDNVHEQTKSYKCKFCEKIFNKSASHSNHVRTKHSTTKLKKPDPVKCEICEKSFNNKHVLEYHIKTVHEGSEKCECNTCGKKIQ